MHKTLRLTLVGAAFAAGIAGPHSLARGAVAGEEKKVRPNVIYILADDLGYGELGCYGQQKIRTPHLDRLAAEGMRFTRHYSGSAVCAPSRFTLMTGKHIGRARTYGQSQKLTPEIQTLPECFRQAGYATGAMGKWGLGNSPNKHGIDEWYGFLDQTRAHFFYPLRIWHNEKELRLPENKGLRTDGRYGPDRKNGTYIHDEFTRHALQFIDSNKDKPFFLYLPYTIPHMELIVPDDGILAEYKGKWEERPFDTKTQNRMVGKRKLGAGGGLFYDGHGYCSNEIPRATYAAMVTRLDRDVGLIMDRLRKHGLDERTLVIFSSDNGPSWFEVGGYDREFFKGAGPLRAGKGDYYEGGIRVPMIARWPGQIAAGKVSDHVSYFPDVMPTLLELAGLPPVDGLDGISIAPTLLGQGRQRSHDFLFWEHAIRIGDWKYVSGGKNYDGSAEPGKGQLFNLAEDLSEQNDVAGQHPEVVAKMIAIHRKNRIPGR